MLKISFLASFYCTIKVSNVARAFPKLNFFFLYYHFSTPWDRHLAIRCACACICRNILIENVTGWEIPRPAINPFLAHKFEFSKWCLPDHPVAVLWKLGCIWPTLQESVTAVSLIRRHHWCWQFVCLSDCSHCLESSPITDTKLSILDSCGTWICAPTVFSNCINNLKSPSTQPTFWASKFKIFYFCANKRSCGHT